MTQNNKVQQLLNVSVTKIYIKRRKLPGKEKYFQVDFENNKKLYLD